MLVLSPTLNTFQVSRSGNEDFEVGTVSATCTRPWLFGKAPQKSLWESKDKNVFEGKEMRKDLCNRVGDLYSQNISADGHKRYLGSEYMDFRSIAIEQFDAVSLLPMVVVDPLVVCDRFDCTNCFLLINITSLSHHYHIIITSLSSSLSSSSHLTITP